MSLKQKTFQGPDRTLPSGMSEVDLFNHIWKESTVMMSVSLSPYSDKLNL